MAPPCGVLRFPDSVRGKAAGLMPSILAVGLLAKGRRVADHSPREVNHRALGGVAVTARFTRYSLEGPSRGSSSGWRLPP